MNYTISQSSEYATDEIMKEILLKMAYKDYEVITNTDKILTFNGNTGNISRTSILWYVRVYKGEFEITDQGDKRIVQLQYQVFSKIELIMCPLIIGFWLMIGIEANKSFGYAAATVFAAMIITNFFTLYFTAKNMLKDILF